MNKKFNITGPCIPENHYMVDTGHKIEAIYQMIERGEYLVINRPCQYGKSTTLFLLNRFLKKQNQYLPIKISFEGIGAEEYTSTRAFIDAFLMILAQSFHVSGNSHLVSLVESHPVPETFPSLDQWITKLVETTGKKIVLIIDEADSNSNNQLFLDFLGMLKNKYLKRDEGISTFHSVILAGLHDLKTLNLKIRAISDTIYHSPWNIAVKFNVNLSFSAVEIQTMLQSYAEAEQVVMDIPLIACRLYYYTSGYPFLVSYLCKVIHEELMPLRASRQWEVEDLDKAFQIALTDDHPNFDSLVKNLESHSNLYEYVFRIVMTGADFLYNPLDPLIQLGVLHGILKEESRRVKIHNRVYEQMIYNYMASKISSSGAVAVSHVTSHYLDGAGNLDIQKIFGKFQMFMKEHYSTGDHDFLERNGRLLFLAFLRPVLNGRGFDFKEAQISEERRLDIVVTFDAQKYIIELKVWRGEVYHKEGLHQFCNYLESQNLSTGYLLIFDLRKEYHQTGKWGTIELEGKKIIATWV